MDISIIGAGSWGTALANLLVKNHHQVLIYDVDDKVIHEINTLHTNETKLKNVILESGIKATTNLTETLDFSNIQN